MFLLEPYHFIILITFLRLAGTKLRVDDKSTASTACSTSENRFCRGSISIVKCRIKRICELQNLIESKNQVVKLDLSSNRIQNISEGELSSFSGVQTLSLAHNDIQVLSYEAFCGLDNLTTLNLSVNPLRTFTGNSSGLFPSLSTLDATGIVHWKPEKQFLHSVRMLQRITNLTWSAECTNCLFFRNENKTELADYYFLQLCYVRKFGVDVSSPLFQLLNDTQFEFLCDNQNYCMRKNYMTRFSLVNRCWDETVMAINCQSLLGGLSVVFNFATFLNIVTSKRLRKTTSMMFVSNLAFSDFLTGFYIIAVTVRLNSFSFLHLYYVPQNCWKVGIFWMLGQTSAVVTSFYLTLERYLVIVYSLQPEVRITRRLAVLLVLFCWIFAIILSGIALYYNFYKYSFMCIPIRLDLVHPHLFAFTISIGIVALMMYGISFGFYVHIYITVKRAAQDAGVKRESKLAKRIALLVFSNVFFFFLPVFLVGLVSIVIKHFSGPSSSKLSEVFKELFLKVFPSLCLSLNSCINPVLHAFRNDAFREVFKGRIMGFCGKIRANRVSPELPRNPQLERNPST